MKEKLYSFSMVFEFIAENEKGALEQFQEVLDDSHFDCGVMKAGNWKMEEDEVDVTDQIYIDTKIYVAGKDE